MPLRLLIFAMLLCAAPAAALGAPAITAVTVGFGGVYKLGVWTPVRVVLAGLGDLEAPRVEVVAPDGDGSPAIVTQELARRGDRAVVHILARVGRRGAVLTVRLLDGGKTVATWRTGAEPPPQSRPFDAPLVVTVGSSGTTLGGELTGVPAAMLPTSPLAYEGVSTLVIRTSDPRLADELQQPAAQAIRNWVRSGGRLVILGGASAEPLIGPDGPLRGLSPGTFREVVRLADTGPIEDYADTDTPIDLPRASGLPATRLENVRGTVELYAGGRTSEMPLVVRSLYGFGEVTWVAFDSTADVFVGWKGRERMMQLLIPAAYQQRRSQDSDRIVTRAYSDLDGALYVKLGAAFTGVRSVSVMTLVAAVGLYIALLGPGAYFFGKQVTGSMQSAWFTFPAIALVVGLGAWAWGRAATGVTPRLNQLQLVDVDCQSGDQRGYCWAQLFSPKAQRYDLSCQAADDNPLAGGYLAWWGLPGRGLGGMQTAGGSLLSGEVPYRLAPTLDGMQATPINRRASKSLLSRWSADTPTAVSMELSPGGSGLVEGVVVNDSDLQLTDVRLLAGRWAWRLPDLVPGGVASVDVTVSPSRWRTMLLADYGQANTSGGGWDTTDRLTNEALLHLMLFRQTLGGPDAAPLDGGDTLAVDLSHALRAGRPVLLARASEPRVVLHAGGEPIDPEAAPPTVLYRFIGPPLDVSESTDR